MRALLFTVLTLVSSVAAAEPDRLMSVLSAIDVVPTRAQLLEAGGGAERLLAIASDEALPRYPRWRAAGLLGHFPEARAGLERLIDSPAITDSEVKVQALAAWSGLAADPTPRLSRLLAHPDEELRAAAARGLVRRGTPEARRLLRGALEARRLRADVASLVRAMRP